MNNLDEIMRSPMKRRAFLTRMGSAGLGAAAVAALGSPLILAGCGGSNSSGSGSNNGGNDPFKALGLPGANVNQRVLNFALTLEILEADLYRQALGRAAGFADYKTRPLAANPNAYSLAIPAGSVQPADGFRFLKQFTYAEAAHRDFLMMVLGGAAVKANPKGYSFKASNGDPGSNLSAILTNILPLEETGVRAYLGAVPYITDFQVVGPAAGGIFSTEARHSAVINDALGNDPGPTPNQVPGDKAVDTNPPSGVTILPNSFERYLEPAQVIQAATQAYIVTA